MKPSTKKSIIDFTQNSIVILVELILSLVCGSCSTLINTLHDITDCTANGLGIFSSSVKKQNRKSYSVLCLISTSAFLLVASGAMLILGIQKVIHTTPIDAWLMLVVALIGVVFNGMLVLKNKEWDTMDIHILEDVIGWIIVLALSLLMILFHWFILDGIITIMLSLYSIFHIGRNFYDVFLVLTSPTNEKTQWASNEVPTLKDTATAERILSTSIPTPLLVDTDVVPTVENVDNIVDHPLEENTIVIENNAPIRKDIEQPNEIHTLSPTQPTMGIVNDSVESCTFATEDPAIATDNTQDIEELHTDPQVELDLVATSDTATDDQPVTQANSTDPVSMEKVPSVSTETNIVLDVLEQPTSVTLEEVKSPDQEQVSKTISTVESNNEKVHGRLSSIMGNLDTLLATQSQTPTPVATEEEDKKEETVVTDEYLQALFDNIIARKEERLRNKQSH